MKIDRKNQILNTGLQGGGNTSKRNEISESLRTQGFMTGGCYSTSACFRWEKNSLGWKLTWGCKCNIGGKYFSLYKYFQREKELLSFLKYEKNNN